MSKFGISLSGGGFRATLYHLGVIRFLRDAGALQQVTDIASVSGGSVLAAHLALNWDRYTGDDSSFDAAAMEVVKFVQFDVRNHILRRLPLQLPLQVLARLHLWNPRKLTPNAILERYYERRLYGDRCVYELPENPMLHILTTNVSSGGMSVFNRNGLYLYDHDEAGDISLKHVPGQMAGIPKAVGASSAFPGFFPPVEITAADLGVPEGQFPTEYFTDGGVYDNLGLRAFSWLRQHGGDFDQIFVSDAGKPFQILTDGSPGYIGQLLRSSDIAMDRVWQLELEHFREQTGFVFFPMTGKVDLADDPTALHPVIQAEVQSIRTDLDRFSNLEVITLGMHGYEVARDVCRKQAVLGDQVLPSSRPWALKLAKTDVPGERSSSRTGGRDLAAETRVSRELRLSSHRRTWSTLLDWRDWPSYLYAAIAFVLIFLAPFKLYQLYQTSQRQKTVIESIKKGDPDIRQILELTNTDPTSGWENAVIQEKSEASNISYEGMKFLEHSRIIDLRHWDPDQPSPAQRGNVYLRDRITLKLLPSYRGDGQITIQVPTKAKNMQFRQPDEQPPCVISRITEPVDYYGKMRTVYEFAYDLSDVAPDEPVTIEVELLLDYPKSTKVPFVTHAKTDLVSVWLMFPADRPYRTYSLVHYPLDGSEPPGLMASRYSIDHPFGSLIGWSVVTPEEDHVYECRWTTE